MRDGRRSLAIALVLAVLSATGALAGPSDAEKCEADKLKRTGLYASCRLKADSKALKTGQPPDYTRCDQKIAAKFSAAETRWGGGCPTTGDVASIQSQATVDTDFLALKLSGARFVDNGDGTVTDAQTALMWEQKTDDGSIHDTDDFYTWSDTVAAPDGTVFTTFLGALNNGTSADGSTVGGCFAGYCDWRLPSIVELRTILLSSSFPCLTDPCIDSIFGPTQSGFYWSTTTVAGDANRAWVVGFTIGLVDFDFKVLPFHVRAVRGGL
jgi:hypothetical protein